MTTTTFEIDSILHSESFPHEVTQLEKLETHISWVILTGEYAYKIKKPVNFGFVDYESLAGRKHYCELEIELNGRFAPEIYLGVVPIFQHGDRGRVGAVNGDHEGGSQNDTPVEYAVKMKQFPQEAIVASRLNHPQMDGSRIEAFGKSLAEIHQSIQVAEKEIVEADQPVTDARDNFPVLRDYFAGDDRLDLIEKLETWTESMCQQLKPEFARRLSDGHIRRCHGDLHLKNIVQLDGTLIAFDGIEFNEQLQWIDVLADVAFPVMDFWARDRDDLAWRLMNGWFEISGDYRALPLFRFYLVYRAMVRAKVTCLNPKNRDPQERQKYAPSHRWSDQLAGPWDKYLKAAEWWAFKMKPRLSITHGFSGSGKSTRALEMIETEGGIRIRSDVERNRIMNQHPEFDQHDKYATETSDRVYHSLKQSAASALDGHFPALVDATFLKRARRIPFEQLAATKNVEYSIIDCQAPFEELKRRIQGRENDPSEATLKVLQQQIQNHDPLTDAEKQYVRNG